jgi:Flp pilus assembly protein TadG
MSSARRRRQAGQVLPVVAVFATALLGAAALAVDLGVNTHTRRNLQNITDAAALAGARDLNTAPVTQAERISGAQDAIATMHTRLQWPLGGVSVQTYASNTVTAATGCASTGTSCVISFVPAGGLSIIVNSPPVFSGIAAHRTSQYFEVLVRQTSTDNLGVAIGYGQSIEGAHSVAYHMAPNQAFGFALFSQQSDDYSNHPETIQGNVYAGRRFNAQSNGQADLCAQGGSVVLGAPQAPNPIPSPDLYNGLAQQGNANPTQVTTGLASCPTSHGGGMLGQTNAEGCQNITISGITFNSGNSYTDDTAVSGTTSSTGSRVGNTKACVADPALTAPDLQGPPLPSSPPSYGCGGGKSAGMYSPGIYTCGLTVDAPLRPGFYEIVHNSTISADVTFSGAQGTCSAYQQSLGFVTGTDVCLPNVTFVLQNGGSPASGATISETNNHQNVSITPYNSGSTDPNDGRFAVYSPTGVTSNISASSPFSLLAFQGTVYMPSGSMSASANAGFSVDGQVIAWSYSTHGGNHFATEITFNGGVAAVQRETLRLVE